MSRGAIECDGKNIFSQKSKVEKSQNAKSEKAESENSGNFCERKTACEIKTTENPFKPPRTAESQEFTLASFFFIVPVIQ